MVKMDYFIIVKYAGRKNELRFCVKCPSRYP